MNERRRAVGSDRARAVEFRDVQRVMQSLRGESELLRASTPFARMHVGQLMARFAPRRTRDSRYTCVGQAIRATRRVECAMRGHRRFAATRARRD